MRMAELSRESGVPVATIKYYLREGLLPPGERTSPNQARYDAAHVRRLKLIRALLDIGGLSIAAVRDVIAGLGQETSTHDVLGIAQHGLPLPTVEVSEEARAWAMERLEALADKRDWVIAPGTPIVEALVGVLCTYRDLGHPELAERLDDYAEAADLVAGTDLDTVAALGQREAIVEAAVIGTVLGDALHAALRRLAHAKASRDRFGATAVKLQ
ncbi:MerR family transcriptional regulator [Prauserella flavalba]|uniref:MerR family transcriptional regulator n=1 Tax=Prauserella flavalba TaxID=1477506 RepID=A0A318LRL9_9PSEU|nr:MerR family transcriptional regulator [Prauserella flavalba]PXY37267.1 MerR family transcriptional regulator [Prauserella flavalba]